MASDEWSHWSRRSGAAQYKSQNTLLKKGDFVKRFLYNRKVYTFITYHHHEWRNPGGSPSVMFFSHRICRANCWHFKPEQKKLIERCIHKPLTKMFVLLSLLPRVKGIHRRTVPIWKYGKMIRLKTLMTMLWSFGNKVCRLEKMNSPEWSFPFLVKFTKIFVKMYLYYQ